MVTAVTSNVKQRSSQNPKRLPLLPSDSDNGPPRRPKAREVTSRYLSFSTSTSSTNSSSSTNTTASSVTSRSSVSSRRCRSPMLSSRGAITTLESSVKERAVSAERRRPAVAASDAERTLMTSIRTLSVSFQGESFSLLVNKVKPPPTSAGTPRGLGRATPERRKAGVTPVRDQRARDRENPRPIDQQHRWPGRLRGRDSSFVTPSLDYSSERGKLIGSGSELESNNFEVRGINKIHNRLSFVDRLNSDFESVSSESTASGNAVQSKGGPRGIVVPTRFREEVNDQELKVPYHVSPVSNNGLRRKSPSKLIIAKKFQNDSPVSSPREVFPCRGLSPLREGVRLASPSKVLPLSTSALFRGMASPTRTRNGVSNLMNNSNMCSTPSMLSFAADVRKGKLGENQIVDAHDLRILHNRQLQWRLGNARVENALLVQKQTAERSLYNAWVSTSKLRHSVKSKRIQLQLLRHNLKLYSVLKEQEPHLENWDLFDRDHCNSLSGAIKALESSTIRLPIFAGARADIQKVQEAISSAVDVMQALASSICSLLAKVEQTNLLVSELSSLSAQERALLDEFKDFLSTTFIPLQVAYCSLRTHMLQVPATLRKPL
ncbi:hypothetical protein CDL12_05183 [Handroanthus impetiginosus]|uniref:QWRF family protein n=1 Tax=Handroanthus impetiginosus TaxID=429701 RepID=A0A2G9HX79_9LAMI|nr:hypothetical protein CDL12_05183 [Handroanthus impetiginosus]